MANNTSSRQAGHAARYVVARVLRGLFWCLKYTVILPLATMALMALFVLWKDNTTPGKLLVKEINFVRQTAPAGQFPVSECWFSSSDSSGRSEIQDICHYRAADAADYVRETDRSLMQLVNRADSIVGNTGQQCSAQEISRSEYTNYTCERDLQVEQYCTRTARMELQGSTTWETRTLEYEMSQLPGHVCHAVSRQGNLSDLHRQSCLYPGVTPVCLLLRRRCLSA